VEENLVIVPEEKAGEVIRHVTCDNCAKTSNPNEQTHDEAPPDEG
jgi:hypothetical protein